MDEPVHTGLLDLPEPVQETPNLPSVVEQITVAVNSASPIATAWPPVPLPAGFGPPDLVRLAREIATNIHEISDVLKVFKLTEAQYDFIKTIPYFQQTLDTLTIEWNSAASTEKRIKLGAAAIIESNLTHIGARMTKADEPFPAQIEAGKLLAKLAGIGEQTSGGASGEKFTININLGEDTKIQYIKDVTPAPSVAGSAGALPSNPQES